MGPIQSSLNQLTLSILGATAGIAKGLKGGFAPQKQKSNEQKVEQTKLNPAEVSDYKVQEAIKLTTPGLQDQSAIMSDVAGLSGNDMIKQKARASSRTFNKRLSMIRKRKMGR